MVRRCLPWLGRITSAAVGGTFVGAWFYRPVADNTSDLNGPVRSEEVFCSSTNPYIREKSPYVLELARALSIGTTTILIRMFMNTYGTFTVVNDDNYEHFVKTVLGEGREGQRGLVTISNHRSLFDDPGVMSGVLPWWIALRPRFNRWGICSQEYCFNDTLPGIVKGYIGAGQVLPICRSKGLDQKLLLDFARHLASGEWCHIFPEGGVWQLPELGGRHDLPGSGGRGRVSGPGKLRWGVGKLIAHAPVTPRVIPFAHAGMENVLPQDKESGTTSLKRNFFDRSDPLQVLVRFGSEISFEDLIRDHEAEHGILWKYDKTTEGKTESDDVIYGGLGGRGNRGDFHRRWDSSAAEKELYSRIASRIEIHLEALTKSVVAKHEENGAVINRRSP